MAHLKALVGVVVLYRCNLEESNTIASLDISLGKVKKRLNLLVYDNGPKKQSSEEEIKYGNFDISYKHDPTNPGISKAYNEGIGFATKHGADWILLLDQDTFYGSDFVGSFLKAIAENIPDETVCIIPKAVSTDNNALISPSKYYSGGIMRPVKNIEPGLIDSRSITGINSGTIISPKFIESIGGFSENYPLDMLDHWYFREIKRMKKRIILMNSLVHHNLSVSSFFQEVSMERYNSLLWSENRFYRGNLLDFCIYKLRLIFRLLKQLKAKEQEYAKLTFKYLTK